MARTALSLIAFACLSIGALASNKEKKTVRKVEIDVYDRMMPVDTCTYTDPGDYCDPLYLDLFVTVSDDPGKLYNVRCNCGTDPTCLILSAPFYSGEIRGKRMMFAARAAYDENGQVAQTPIPFNRPGTCRIESIVPLPTGGSPVGESSEASTQTLQETSGSATAAASQEQDTQQIPQDVTGEAHERKEQEAASELDLDPEVFYRLDAGKLVQLESQKLLEVRITKWSDKVRTTVPGEKSPVRFRGGESLEFVFRQQIPFRPVYSLRKLEAKEGKREWVETTRRSGVSFSEYGLPLHYYDYGKGSIRVTTQALTRGEYALRSEFAQTVFCFGVD